MKFEENTVYKGGDNTARKITKLETWFTKGGQPFNVIHWHTKNTYEDIRVPFRLEKGISMESIFRDWLSGKYRDGLKPPILKM